MLQSLFILTGKQISEMKITRCKKHSLIYLLSVREEILSTQLLSRSIRKDENKSQKFEPTMTLTVLQNKVININDNRYKNTSTF